MFAMLTGNLPFTVEPFNIKQLHQKMINGEISSLPDDISRGEAARAAASPSPRGSVRINKTGVQECTSV